MKEENDKLLHDLFLAYYDARKNKRNTTNQMKFEIDYEHNLFELYEDILARRYKIRPSICFVVEKPVKREIFAADFRDRVVHHLVCGYINPIFERVFIHDSFSCRKGKGTLFGIQRLDHHIRSCSQNYSKDCYILKLDLRGYFMSINRKLLLKKLIALLEKYRYRVFNVDENGNVIRWNDCFDFELVFYLLDIIVNNDPTINCRIKGQEKDWDGVPFSKSLFTVPEGVGLPIGNLTSQLFSNIYLNDFDHYLKETLRLKYYGRYVDDFYVIHSDLAFLNELKKTISTYLQQELELCIHPNKIYLQHYRKGVTFLGACVKPHVTFVCQRVKASFLGALDTWDKNLSRKPDMGMIELEKMRSTINSYLGIMQHHKTFKLKRKIFSRKSRLCFRYGYMGEGMNTFYLKKKYKRTTNIPKT